MKKNLFKFFKTLKLRFKKGLRGYLEINIEFNWAGRRIHFNRSCFGWHNFSEMHTRENCHDPAYCQWHGAL